WSSVARPRIAGKRLGARGVRWMTTITQASRSPGSAPRTTWIARMPPAEPTTATTWIARRSNVRAIRPREEAADRLRLPAGLLGDGLEAPATALGSGASEPLGEPVTQLRALVQRAQRRPERRLDRLRLVDDHSVGGVCMAHPAAEPEQLVVELPQNAAARWAGIDRGLPDGYVAAKGFGVEGR